jgi:hypothetical protein
MAYVEPKTEITQSFVNQASNTLLQKLYSVIVGPGYRIDSDEDTGETYNSGAGNSYSYDISGTTEAVDTRASDTDEATYPITVWIEDAKALRYDSNASGTTASLGEGLTQVIDGTAPLGFTPKASGVIKFRLNQNVGNIYHKVNDVASITLNSPNPGQTTIAFNTPILGSADDDTGKDFTNGYTAETGNIVSVAADYKSLVIDTVLSSTTVGSTGNLVWGPPNAVDASHEYTATKVSASTLTLSGWNSDYYFSACEYDVLEIFDYTLTKTTHWTTTSTALTVLGSITEGGNALETYGTIHVAYRALRTDICSSVNWTDPDDSTASITSGIGTIVYYNTLAYGVYRASINCAGLKVGYVGVDATYLTDKATAFSEAIDVLLNTSSADGVYHLAPLSQLTSVHQSFDNHVDAASTKERGLWRVCYINKAILSSKAVVSATTAETAGDGQAYQTFKDTSGSGSFSLAAIDDILMITGWTKIARGLIDTYTSTAGVTCTWDAGTKTLSFNENIGTAAGAFSITAAELIGRNIRLEPDTDSVLTDTDDSTATYTDTDHPLGFNSQKFGANGTAAFALGYKVTAAAYGATSTITLDEVDPSATLHDVAAVGTRVFKIHVYDTVLSAAHETAILARENKIASIVSNTEVGLDDTLATLTFAGPVTAAYTGNYVGVTYVVYGSPSKAEQASNIAAYAASFANRRTRLVWPDEYKDESGNTIKGYMLCAEVAGYFSGKHPQQGLTNSAIASGYQLQHTNGYFSNTNLNTIADGGVMIFTQSTDGAQAACRQQLTTDDSTVYYKEASITHSVDTACYVTMAKLDPFLGKYNITQQLFDDVATAIEGVKKVLLKPKPRIGGILKKYELTAIEQNASNLDEVDVTITAVPNVPVNRFNVTMRVS